MNELVKISDCELTATGAKFRDKLTFEQWLAAGRQLCQIGSAIQWWLGDWVNAGDAAWGEKYTEALKITELEYDYLRKLAQVSNAVALCNRQHKLTWSHHYEVAPLNLRQQKKWLALAAEGNDGQRWTVSQLRVALRLSLSEFAGDENEPTLNLCRPFKAIGDFVRFMKTDLENEPFESWTRERLEAFNKQTEGARELLNSAHQKLSEFVK